jgi:hypothetical protein
MNLKLMFFKRSLRISLALLSLALIAIGIFGKFSAIDMRLPFIAKVEVNSFTGAPGTDGPVLVVKIDDTSYAHPQVGLRSADIIYIEQVEGGLTRLAAIFSSTIPEQIGPVRSARISDLELLAQYGKVGFAYSGAQRKLLPEIANANLFDVGANKYGPHFYANSPERIAPYAMMLSAPELMAEANIRGATFATSSPMGWSFGEKPQGLTQISGASISWPAAKYEARWSAAERRWLLFHDGRPNLDETGYQLGSPTIVVQLVSITDSIYRDKVGGVTPFSATVGSGSCYLLRDGGYLPCRWERATPESGTTFTDVNGMDIHFAPGQIWFALTSEEPVFTASPPEDATSLASK